jgi:hypothetical protein
MMNPHDNRSVYTGANPDVRVMYGEAVDDDRRRMIKESEGMPTNIQTRLRRVQRTQALWVLVGIVLFIAILILLAHIL